MLNFSAERNVLQLTIVDKAKCEISDTKFCVCGNKSYKYNNITA